MSCPMLSWRDFMLCVLSDCSICRNEQDPGYQKIVCGPMYDDLRFTLWIGERGDEPASVQQLLSGQNDENSCSTVEGRGQ